MVLTEFAQSLVGHLHRGMAEFERVLSGRTAFVPDAVSTEFVLATLDGFAASLMSHLWYVLRGQAPRARLRYAADAANSFFRDVVVQAARRMESQLKRSS